LPPARSTAPPGTIPDRAGSDVRIARHEPTVRRAGCATGERVRRVRREHAARRARPGLHAERGAPGAGAPRPARLLRVHPAVARGYGVPRVRVQPLADVPSAEPASRLPAER